MGRWEEVFKWARSLAQEAAKALLENDDGADERKRTKALSGMPKRCRIITVFGDIKAKRRLYRDSNGEHRSPLDEKRELDKGCHVSPKAKELATFSSSHFPFLGSEKILRAILLSGIFHTTIHRHLAKVINPYLEAKEKEIKEVFEAGITPESEGKIIPHLFVKFC